MNLVIGSGDVSALMAGKNTVTFQNLLRKFVAAEKPVYNALASPIDALRTGAILEKRYLATLPESYMVQYKVTNPDMDAFTASLDFARIEGGKVVDFDELKTLYFADFVEFIEPIRNGDYLETIQKKFKKYYQQIQLQLFCSGLEAANLVFIPVYAYNDEENALRDIQPNEVAKFRIPRDEEVIRVIRQKATLFQYIKDYFKPLNPNQL